MSRAVSPATGKVYGLQRVCRVLGVARSTVYARRKAASNARPEPAKRGPKPAVSDEALLEAIRSDLAASPLHGEGHRKVWARLKFGHGMRVARNRVLRVMRDNHLLSHRHRPQDAPNPHDPNNGG